MRLEAAWPGATVKGMIRELLILGALSLPAHAHAGEVFGGLMAQGVGTPVSAEIGEHGVALAAGWRSSERRCFIVGARCQRHLFISANTAGGTSFIAGGFTKTWGDPVYFRAGIGLAVRDGPSRSYDSDGRRTDLGSRVLFEPEIAVGAKVGERFRIEAAWVHLSHAYLASDQNPGLDMIGVRVSLDLP